MSREMSDRTYARAQEGAFAFEHLAAYLTALTSAVMVVVGLLEGVGAIDLVSAGDVESSFFDGLLFLIPAATLAFLSFYFHTADHHRMRDVRALDDQDASMWGMEHLGAMIAAGTSLVLMIVGLLVGFGAIDTANAVQDGLIWQIAALVPAILSCTLHQVRHHQVSSEHDHVVAIIEQRIATRERDPSATGRGAAVPTRR